MYYYKNEKMMEYKQLLDEINWIDIERILYSIQKTLEGRQFINTYITAIIIPLFLFIISLEFSACGGKISELIYFASCTTLVLVILSLTYIRLLDCCNNIHHRIILSLFYYSNISNLGNEKFCI